MKDNVLFGGGQERSASPKVYSCSNEGSADNHANSNGILSVSVNDILSMTEHLGLGIFICDQDDRLCLMNDLFMSCTGLSRPFSSIPIESMFHPEDAGHYLSAYRHILDGEYGYTRSGFKIRSNKGEFLPATISMMKILLGSSFVVINFVNWKDEIKETRIFQEMVDAYPEIALVIDSQYRIIAANQRLAYKIEIPKNDIIQKNLIQLTPKKIVDKRKRILDQVLNTGTPRQFMDDLNEELYEHFLTPIKDEHGRIQYIFIMCKNLSDLVYAEKSISLLSRQLLTAIEEERKKIAYDLHDECGQLVAVVGMGLSTLKESLPDDLTQSKAICDNFTGIIEKLSEKIRSMSTELHPDMIDHCGLVPAIEFYMKTVFNGSPSIAWEFKSNVDVKRLGPQVDIVLYRIIQESLNNVIKHAKAKNVTVNLYLENKRLYLTVQDDGVGFEQNGPGKRLSPHSMGILGMMERAATIDGSFTIKSQPHKGTLVTVSLSVPKDKL